MIPNQLGDTGETIGSAPLLLKPFFHFPTYLSLVNLDDGPTVRVPSQPSHAGKLVPSQIAAEVTQGVATVTADIMTPEERAKQWAERTVH